MSATVYTLHKAGVAYKEKQALDGVSLALEQGRFYGIIGPNGSGKTTLVNLLADSRQSANISGDVIFYDKPVTAYTRIELARKLAVVPQEITLGFDFTVYEVVLMGRNPYLSRFASPSAKDHQLVEQNIKQLDLWHYRNQPANRLSGGEKQRVVIARALTQKTPVILLDEATSSLDIHHSISVMKLLREMVLKGKLTVIASIHDLNLACAFCTDLVALKNGTLQVAGPTSQIMTNDFVRRIFDVEAQVTTSNNHNITVQYAYNGPQSFTHEDCSF